MATVKCPGCGLAARFGVVQCPACQQSLIRAQFRALPAVVRGLIITGIAILCGLLVLVAILPDPKKPAVAPVATPSITRPTDAQLDAAIAAVKKRDKVLSAAWNNRTLPSLLVGVAGAGKQPHAYDGFAKGICRELEAHGVKGAYVHVLDNFSGDWVELGKAECP